MIIICIDPSVYNVDDVYNWYTSDKRASTKLMVIRRTPQTQSAKHWPPIEVFSTKECENVEQTPTIERSQDA